MDEVGSDPARDRSAAELRMSGSDGVDASRQTKGSSDVTPESKTKGRSNSAFSSALVQFCAVVGNLGRHMWRQATDLSSPAWPPKWLNVLAALWILWLGILIIWLVVAIIIPVFIKILVALGLTTSVLVSGTEWAEVLLKPVHNYLDIHSASLPFSPEQLFSFWILFGIVLFFSSFGGSIGGRIGWAVFGLETSAMVWNGMGHQSLLGGWPRASRLFCGRYYQFWHTEIEVKCLLLSRIVGDGLQDSSPLSSVVLSRTPACSAILI